MPRKTDEPIDYNEMNNSELRQIILIQLGVRVSRLVPQRELIKILTSSEVKKKQLDPLMEEREKVEAWIFANRQSFSNQLRCKGNCTTGPCTDMQVLMCYTRNRQRIEA